jgi:hypothetical protein
MSHTPGPWHVHDKELSSNPYIVADSEGRSIADCKVGGPWTSSSKRGDRINEADISAANASLIAAAPDLLAACKAAIQLNKVSWEQGTLRWAKDEKGMNRLLEVADESNKIMAQIKAAITKAEGRS